MSLRNVVTLVAAISLTACAAAERKAAVPTAELAPTGKLRVGIVVATVASPFLTTKDPASSQARGVTVDLGSALARQVGVPVELVTYATPPALIDGVKAGSVDVTFVPIDSERAKVLDFGPAYFLFDNTYLVPHASSIRSAAEIDRPGVRVAVQDKSVHVAQLKGLLKNATLTAGATAEDLYDILRTGKADAIAHARPLLITLSQRLPGSRVLDASFSSTRLAVAVPRGRPNALAYVSQFIETAKSSGVVQQAFDGAGLKGYSVAPPEKR
jgi:polar amino acid transport system substrate-binding protein